jgi:hypothetical protein
LYGSAPQTLFELLTVWEALDRAKVFDMELLAQRLFVSRFDFSGTELGVPREPEGRRFMVDIS